MKQLIEKRKELESKQAALAKVFEEAKATQDGKSVLDLGKVTSLGKGQDGKAFTSLEIAEKIRGMNAELTDLGKEVETLVGVELAERDQKAREELLSKARIEHPDGGNGNGNGNGARRFSGKTIGQLFVESAAFKQYDKTQRRGPTVEIDLEKEIGEGYAPKGLMGAIEQKTTLDTITGYATQPIRLPGIITPLEMGLTVADLIPQGTTMSNAVPYMEETTTTPAAAETAEGAAKPEAALAFSEKTSPVRKIAVFLPVTNELFDDVPAMQSYVQNRLGTFVRQREDGQLLTGDGAGVNLRGLLNVVGIQTQAKGADPTPDAIYKGMTKVQVVGFLDPSGVVMHPNDWQDIRLLRTVDGIYIWGNPSELGPERIWGLPIVKTTRMTEGTALVGAYRDAAQIFRRQEVAFAVSDSHSDFFQKNLLAIRAEERLALVVDRPKGFCTVTGI
jgi:HK97 family phage major capsid protein